MLKLNQLRFDKYGEQEEKKTETALEQFQMYHE